MRFPGFQNSADAAKAVAKLLRSDFWLPTLQPNTLYTRLQDDHDGKRWGILSVMFGEDSDAWVSIDMNGIEMLDRTIRFRLPVVGGGRSPRTRTALHILAEAIRLDNEERAQDLSPHPSVVERYSRKETRPAPDDRWIQHEHTAAHDCACRDCVAAETSVTRCSCKDFPGSDQFCTAHKCNCAGTAPTMPTFRTEHLSTCPCSAANR
jgi:hypothetical protein